MGGIVCQIPANAILAGATPPVQPANVADQVYVSQSAGFDARLRQCFAQTDIAHGIEDMNLGPKACAILAKEMWSAEDREALWAMLQSLWPQGGW